jgi:hypothetical protein
MLRSAILLGSMGYQTTAACDERPPACGSRDSLKTGTNTGPPGKDHRADCERRQSQLKKTRQKTISASDCCQEKIPSKPASRAQFPVGECWNRLTTAIAAIVGTARKSKPRGWATFAVCAKVGFHSPKWDFAFLLLCNWQESSGIGIAGVEAPFALYSSGRRSRQRGLPPLQRTQGWATPKTGRAPGAKSCKVGHPPTVS